MQAQVRGRARYNFNPESSSEDVDSILQSSGSTPRQNKVRQITSTTEAQLPNRQREKLVRPTIPTSRRVDIVSPTKKTETITTKKTTEETIPQQKNSQRKLARPSSQPTKISVIAQDAEHSSRPSPKTGSRIVKRKQIRVSKVGNRTTAPTDSNTFAKPKTVDSNQTHKQTAITPRISSTSTSTRKPTTSFRTSTPTVWSTTDSRINRSSSVNTPTTSVPTYVPIAASAASKLIGFPTASSVRRQSTVNPLADETSTKSTQLSSQARRPTTRVLQNKTTAAPKTTVPKAAPSISRGSQRPSTSHKKNPTAAQVEEFDEENYPEHYKLALKAKLSGNSGGVGSNEVSSPKAPQKKQNDQFTTTKPNSARVTVPKLDTFPTSERIPSGPIATSFDGPDPNAINPTAYVDFQNSLPKYSSRIRHNENRVQEPSHKVRARSQNLSNPRNGNQLLEANGVAASGQQPLAREQSASAVSIINVFFL